MTGWFDFANFYARRARRILPAPILVVLATCALGFFLLDACCAVPDLELYLTAVCRRLLQTE
jgi:peptidoglycan/LPS O-acetylase OafA/YrhL